MKTKIENEKGAGVVEVMLIVVVVLLIGVIGWLVYKNDHKTKTSTASNTTTQTHQSVGTAPCPKGDNTKAIAENTDSSDNRVTCALAYGQQQSDKILIDNGNTYVVSALYAKQLGATMYTDGETGIVNVVINNTTSNKQTYDMNLFTLELPNGEEIPFSSLYNYSGSTTVTVASGGKVAQTLIFKSINPTAAVSGQGKLVYTSVSSEKVNVEITFKKPYAYQD